MSNAVETRAARRFPPRSGAVQLIAFTSTAGATELDADIKGKWVTVTNLGAGAVWVLFGGSSVTVDATATSGATLGRKLTSGQSEDWELEASDTHIAHDGDANGNLELVASGV